MLMIKPHVRAASHELTLKQVIYCNFMQLREFGKSNLEQL